MKATQQPDVVIAVCTLPDKYRLLTGKSRCYPILLSKPA